jgi:hypothetical protein
MFEPEPSSHVSGWMVLIYLVIPVAAFVYSAAMKA